MQRNISIAGHQAKNPFVHLPIGLGDFNDPPTIVGTNRFNHYISIAKGGVGTIIVEATSVAPISQRKHPAMPNIASTHSCLEIVSQEQIASFQYLVSQCKQEQVLMLLQLAHTGADVPLDDRLLSDLSLNEMHQIQQLFLQGAINAKRAGFDGIELHAAHGLFLSQVLSPVTNDRNDCYGKTLNNRVHYIGEIIAQIKASCGSDFIVGVRFGCNEPNLQSSLKIATLLEKANADFLDISSGLNGSTYLGVTPPANFPYSKKIYAAAQIQKIVSIPVIVVEGIRTAEQAQDILANNYTQLIGIGKAILADYQWTNKILHRIKPIPCLNCKKCHWYDNHQNCPGYSKQTSQP